MPQTLKGSCHCGAVSFSLQSSGAVPYQLCLCSICRKVGGSGGSINLGGITNTLEVQGRENISVYNAVLGNRGKKNEKRATSERNFCKQCGSMLWLFSPEWRVYRLSVDSFSRAHHLGLNRPDLIHPFASAIDTPLTPPEEMTVLMLDSTPDWVRLPEGKKKTFQHYPDESIEDWHKRHGLWAE
ncbi:hypothetical protein PENSPDRAFT_627162 [Peniophora sp. CONT]|nr:hypothetical protein PENSPDRAFT_627162 [Peniophora sp. CONT]